MPFTPAHPAIILPLLKIDARYVSATGLVIGSMSPDFEYFFKMAVNGEHSHTLAGLLYFDVPVTVLLAFLFHQVAKKNFIDSLPVFLQRRFHTLREFDFLNYFKGNYIAFLSSALIGAASHIFWDGFTHADGFFVSRLSFYRGSYIPFDNVNYPLWYALQHVSTGVGLVIVAGYIALMRSDNTPAIKPSLLYWFVILAVIAMMMMVRFGFDGTNAALGNFVVSMISSLCLALVLSGWLPIQKQFIQP